MDIKILRNSNSAISCIVGRRNRLVDKIEMKLGTMSRASNTRTEGHPGTVFPLSLVVDHSKISLNSSPILPVVSFAGGL